MIEEMRSLRADMSTMQAALVAATTRAEAAEKERSDVIRLAASRSRGDDQDIVDGKGVGQPFKFHGKKDARGQTEQDFAEWSLKFVTFIKAKTGQKEVEQMLKWASRQKKMIVEEEDGDPRKVGYDDQFGELGTGSGPKINQLSKVVNDIYTYLMSFTTGEANKIVRNSGSEQGLEGWRRLQAEFDPVSAMRRVTILGQVQEPARCNKVEELGPALEDWLTKKKQYEQFTDRHGNPCVISEDSLLAAMFKLMPKALEETLLFTHDESTSFEDLYDKLVSYVSAKHSLKIQDRPVGGSGGGGWKKDPDAMDVGSLQNIQCRKCKKFGHKAVDCHAPSAWGGSSTMSGGASSSSSWSGGGAGKGKGGGDKKQNVQCWECYGYGHYGKDCPKRKPKGGGKGGVQGGEAAGPVPGRRPGRVAGDAGAEGGAEENLGGADEELGRTEELPPT